MTELYIMGAALVASGLYISYQYAVIQRYRRALSVAVFALESAYFGIKGEEDEDTDS